MVCFSNNKLFAGFILLATFSDPLTGICGLIAALTAVITEEVTMGSTPHQKDGSYTFNSLLAGLALGALLPPFPFTIVLVMIISSLTVVMSTYFIRASLRTGLPYLSIPFILTIWLLLFSLTVFHYPPFMFRQEQQHIYSTLFHPLTQLLSPFRYYLKSLSNIYFQNDELAGLLLLIGLIVHSRIAVVLTVVGFLFVQFLHGLLPHLQHHLMHNLIMNTLLLFLALSGHYLLPSRRSLAVAILAIPLLTLVNLGVGALLANFLLPTYSLSFSITTFLVLAVIQQRGPLSWPRFTTVQYNSPELNLYNANTMAERFKHWKPLALKVPFFGEWTVSQGYDGTVTHKKAFRHALDFVVTDEFGRTFKNDGKVPTDYYCFELPVLSVANGEVVTIKKDIPDNPIGGNDLLNNWGNTVIIKHSDEVYSKYSHLQATSIHLQLGQTIKAGETLGTCGNSGLSPEPHLHFQLQASDLIDGTTLPYPFHAAILNTNGTLVLKKYHTPKEGERIKRPVVHETLKRIFNFHDGQEWIWEIERNSENITEKWVCRKDAYGQHYLHATAVDATFYLQIEEQFIMSSSYAGSKSCLLFDFYKAMHTIPLCMEKELVCEDVISPAAYENWLKDCISLWQPAKAYKYSNRISLHEAGNISFNATIQLAESEEKFTTCIENGSLKSFTNLQTQLCARLISSI
jgi:murein DD-endopeptidase MepM/ murein hydrolase activator NlpD/urea transporter